MMYFCYLDESGTPEPDDQSDHFVYLGFAIPADTWQAKDAQLSKVKDKFRLKDVEIHTAWMTRPYPEQEKVPDFQSHDYTKRIELALIERQKWLAISAVNKTPKQLKGIRKYYNLTKPYLHLTRNERRSFLLEIAAVVGSWDDARIFCEAVKKKLFDVHKTQLGGIYEDSFQQVVTRFETFLSYKGRNDGNKIHGLLVADNNQSLNQKLTSIMRRFHKDGTTWKNIKHIVETPLFVDSQLTSMIQIADLSAYATRRFFSNDEDALFKLIYPRFDRVKSKVVGIRHFTPTETCQCMVCKDHEKPYISSKSPSSLKQRR